MGSKIVKLSIYDNMHLSLWETAYVMSDKDIPKDWETADPPPDVYSIIKFFELKVSSIVEIIREFPQALDGDEATEHLLANYPTELVERIDQHLINLDEKVKSVKTIKNREDMNKRDSRVTENILKKMVFKKSKLINLCKALQLPKKYVHCKYFSPHKKGNKEIPLGKALENEFYKFFKKKPNAKSADLPPIIIKNLLKKYDKPHGYFDKKNKPAHKTFLNMASTAKKLLTEEV